MTHPADRCPNCRYDRAGLPGDARCPECGTLPPQPEGAGGDDPAMSRAGVALGLAVLAWMGLVGFGILATPLGLGACWVAWTGWRDPARHEHPDRAVRMTLVTAGVLGVTAAVAGLVVFVGLLLVVL